MFTATVCRRKLLLVSCSYCASVKLIVYFQLLFFFQEVHKYTNISNKYNNFILRYLNSQNTDFTQFQLNDDKFNYFKLSGTVKTVQCTITSKCSGFESVVLKPLLQCLTQQLNHFELFLDNKSKEVKFYCQVRASADPCLYSTCRDLTFENGYTTKRLNYRLQV